MRASSVRAPVVGSGLTPSSVTPAAASQNCSRPPRACSTTSSRAVVAEALCFARREGEVRAGGLADGRGVGEDLAHPLVRLERLALDDADRGELAARSRVERLAGSSWTCALSIS